MLAAFVSRRMEDGVFCLMACGMRSRIRAVVRSRLDSSLRFAPFHAGAPRRGPLMPMLQFAEDRSGRVMERQRLDERPVRDAGAALPDLEGTVAKLETSCIE